jgi:hypothetical protein
MEFKYVEKGHLALANLTKLDAYITSAANDVALITTDPLTFDYDAVAGDLVYSAATGLTPQACDTLTNLGPFEDSVGQNVYYKYLGITFTNTSGGDVTVTGLAWRVTTGPVLIGVLVFDDAETILSGGTLTLDVLIGIGQPVQVSTLENLDPA